MANRSVIQVDVDDSKFKAFNALFSKYQAQLEKMPKQWAAVNAAQKVGGKEFLSAATNAAKTASEAAKLAKNMERVAKGQKEVNKGAKDSNIEFRKAAETTGRIAKNVANTTFHLLKWVALGGVLGAATGMFGMDRLAGAAGNTRRTAQGLGASPGQLKAARVNFGNYVDADSMLGKISGAQMDLSKRGIFARLGLDPNKSAGDLLPELLPKLAADFKNHGGTQQWAESSGLTTFAEMSELKRLSGLPQGELAGSVGGYQKDSAALNVQDQQLRSMQLLTNQFDRAANQIENTFIRGLVPLAPALSSLSTSAAKAIETFMGAAKTGEWIKKFGAGIEDAAKYMQTGEFQKGVTDVVTALGYLVKGINTVGGWLFGKPSTPTPAEPKPSTPGMGSALNDFARLQFGMGPAQSGGASGSWGGTGGASGGWGSTASPVRNNPGNLRSWGGMPTQGGFAVFPSEDEGLRAMARQLQLYGNRGNNTIAGMVSAYAPPTENNTAAYIAHVAKQTGYSANQRLDTKNPDVLSKVIAAMTKMENSKSSYTPAGVRAVITVQNQTGGSVNVNANQLPH
jgi:hypothetical protein